jgi:mannose-6-phosphate isomerase
MTDDGGVICRLLPRVQPYAWGSFTAMTEYLGIPSTGEPMAELWLGDHPLLPSLVMGSDLVGLGGLTASEEPASTGSDEGRPSPGLDEVLRADPSSWFDSASLRHDASASLRHGASLTSSQSSSLRFLLKVMAIAEPLSLQTHPNKAQAEEGFAREDGLGISRTAPNRNYRDPNHKPELICALTEMDALSGFRPPDETLALFALVDDPAARRLTASLSSGLDTAMRDGLSGAIFADENATASFAVAAQGAASKNPEHALTFGWWAALCHRHPGDGGIAVATLLHCVRLQPGQALFLGAGNMHAYLSGVGIEIMANSDNVLRGGLTPKHVDIEELLRVTNAVAGPLPLVTPVDVSSQIFPLPDGDSTLTIETNGWICETWPVPVNDFRLLRLRGASAYPCQVQIATRPLIALCTEGEVRLVQGDQTITLMRGQSAIAGKSDDPLCVGGNGTAFLASAG